MGTAHEMAERAQHLAFSVGGGDYAIRILKVKEILQYEELTKVPSTARTLRGVINLRGRAVPVVDLSVKFGLGEASVTKRTCILVVEVELDGAPTVMGVMADAVSEVIELGGEDVEEAPLFGTGAKVDYIVGIGKLGKRLVLLLDVDRILEANEDALRAALAGRAVVADGGAEPTESEAGAAPGECAAAPAQGGPT